MAGAIFVAAGNGNNGGTGGTTVTVNVPTGTVDGDFIVCVLGSYPLTTNPWTATGWQEIPALELQELLSTETSWAAWKIAASEPASYTFTVAPSSKVSGVIVGFRSTDAPIILDAMAVQQNSTSSVNATAPSITPTSAHAALIWFGVANQGNITVTAPTNYILPTNGNTGGTGASSTEVAICYRLDQPASGTGTVIGTWQASSRSVCGQLALIYATSEMASEPGRWFSRVSRTRW